MENKGHIYCINNTENNKKYIGQTVLYRKSGNKFIEFGYKKRFNEHLLYTVKKSLSLLGRNINEIGKDKFSVELLEVCEMEILDERERYWIDYYNTLCPNGYNVLYGAPYSSNPDAKKKISESLLAYFKEPSIRKSYSILHLNKFKEFDISKISTIDIHPIKNNNEYKIVYMYIIFNDNSKQRRRYGGIHEEYDEAFLRSYNDAIQLVDESKVSIYKNRIDSCSKLIDSSLVEVIELKLWNKTLIAVYITFKDLKLAKDKKRYVFGGKTIKIEDAHNHALEFVASIKNPKTVVKYAETLIATLPN